MIALTLGLALPAAVPVADGDPTPGESDYLRPDGVSYYNRPDGTSYYTRP